MPHRNPHARAFTLTELLLAVLVLLVVIAATARIFGTAQRVSSVGEANASILQEAGAIERRLRDDLARLSDKGYMAIRNFAVRNDINVNAGTSQLELLNPDLPADAIVRLDQLVFFAEGSQDTIDFVGTANLAGGSVPSSTVSRITYGHGVQLPDRVEKASTATGFDPDYVMLYNKVLTPWVTDAVSDGPSLRLTATTSAGGTKTVNGTQPGSRDWILSRRSMLLADDGGDTSFHAIPFTPELDANSIPSLFQESAPPATFTISANLQPARALLSGRYDISAMQLNDLERVLTRWDYVESGTNLPRTYFAPWIVIPGVLTIPTGPNAQQFAFFGAVRQRVINGTFGIGATANQAGTSVQVGLNSWPRVERQPPTFEKSDQMLTSGMIGGHCSSFIVEWCWKDGVGRVMEDDRRVKLALDPISGNGTVPMLGFLAPTNGVAPWIGERSLDPRNLLAGQGELFIGQPERVGERALLDVEPLLLRTQRRERLQRSLQLPSRIVAIEFDEHRTLLDAHALADTGTERHDHTLDARRDIGRLERTHGAVAADPAHGRHGRDLHDRDGHRAFIRLLGRRDRPRAHHPDHDHDGTEHDAHAQGRTAHEVQPRRARGEGNILVVGFHGWREDRSPCRFAHGGRAVA